MTSANAKATDFTINRREMMPHEMEELEDLDMMDDGWNTSNYWEPIWTWKSSVIENVFPFKSITWRKSSWFPHAVYQTYDQNTNNQWDEQKHLIRTSREKR